MNYYYKLVNCEQNNNNNNDQNLLSSLFTLIKYLRMTIYKYD